jgi:hypothetical protein
VCTEGAGDTGSPSESTDASNATDTAVTAQARGSTVSAGAALARLHGRGGRRQPHCSCPSDTTCATDAARTAVAVRTRRHSRSATDTTLTSRTTVAAVATGSTGRGRLSRDGSDDTDTASTTWPALTAVATVTENDAATTTVATQSTDSTVAADTAVGPVDTGRASGTRNACATVTAVTDLQRIAAVAAHEAVSAVAEQTTALPTITCPGRTGAGIGRVGEPDTEDRTGIR